MRKLYEIEIARYERQTSCITISARNRREAAQLAKYQANHCGGNWEVDTQHEPRLEIISAVAVPPAAHGKEE
jgi:hypothetical protein